MRRLFITVFLIAAAVGVQAQAPKTPSAPALPAIALPAMEQAPEAKPAAPTTTAPDAPAPAANTETVPSPAPDAEDEETAERIPGYSFGDQPSLMYSTEQIGAMHNALSSVEDNINRPKSKIAVSSSNNSLLPFLNKPTIVTEPNPYPVFYLASMVYRNGSDWTVWLAGRRITPKTNQGELTVSAISPDIVTFQWRPDFMSALLQRYHQQKFLPVDKVKNRLTSMANTVTFNEQDQVISFTLRSNQSFSVAYLSTFEGKMRSTDMPPIDAVVGKGSSSQKAADISGTAKQLLNDMAGSPNAAATKGNTQIDANTVKALQSLLKSQSAATPANTPVNLTPNNQIGPPNPNEKKP